MDSDTHYRFLQGRLRNPFPETFYVLHFYKIPLENLPLQREIVFRT